MAQTSRGRSRPHTVHTCGCCNCSECNRSGSWAASSSIKQRLHIIHMEFTRPPCSYCSACDWQSSCTCKQGVCNSCGTCAELCCAYATDHAMELTQATGATAGHHRLWPCSTHSWWVDDNPVDFVVRVGCAQLLSMQRLKPAFTSCCLLLQLHGFPLAWVSTCRTVCMHFKQPQCQPLYCCMCT